MAARKQAFEEFIIDAPEQWLALSPDLARLDLREAKVGSREMREDGDHA